jgi:hypothetical protein
VIQVQLPPADTFGIPAGQRRSLVRVVRLGRVDIISYNEDNVCEDSQLTSWPRSKGWDGSEEPAREVHTCVKGRLPIRSQISSMGDWVGCDGTTSCLGLDCEGFAGFSGFFDLVTEACLGPSMTLSVFLL